jgi:hypothetical protein
MYKRNFRTDPLDERGNVDSEFFASHDYSKEQQKLVEYLELEGFFDSLEEYFLDFSGRKWHVYPIKKTKK